MLRQKAYIIITVRTLTYNMLSKLTRKSRTGLLKYGR